MAGNRNSGRIPQPTALKALKGTTQANRGAGGHEDLLQPADAGKESPHWLSPEAEEHWNRLAPMLHRLRVLTEADKEMFGRYCEAFVEYLRCRNFIRSNGSSYPIYEWTEARDENGNVMMQPNREPIKKRTLKYMGQFPQVTQMRSLSQEMKSIEENFGMSPSSRTRIIVDVENGNKNSSSSSRFKYSQRKAA